VEVGANVPPDINDVRATRQAMEMFSALAIVARVASNGPPDLLRSQPPNRVLAPWMRQFGELRAHVRAGLRQLERMP